MISLLLVMQRACLCYYIIITYYYVIITPGSIITHYYPFQSPELADANDPKEGSSHPIRARRRNQPEELADPGARSRRSFPSRALQRLLRPSQCKVNHRTNLPSHHSTWTRPCPCDAWNLLGLESISNKIADKDNDQDKSKSKNHNNPQAQLATSSYLRSTQFSTPMPMVVSMSYGNPVGVMAPSWRGRCPCTCIHPSRGPAGWDWEAELPLVTAARGPSLDRLEERLRILLSSPISVTDVAYEATLHASACSVSCNPKGK